MHNKDSVVTAVLIKRHQAARGSTSAQLCAACHLMVCAEDLSKFDLSATTGNGYDDVGVKCLF